MNKEEYKAYQDRFEEFMRLNELTNLSRIDNEDEAYFSWQPCECCQTRLGGNRVTVSGCSRYEFLICADCEYYAEYGQLDDMTMMEIEQG
jgi:hypothetical protein